MWRAALHLRHAAPCATLAAVTYCDADLQRRTTWTASSDKLGPLRVHRIVITGGPCAGKTTAMAKLSDRLTNIGFAVFVVPEVATLTITGGAKPGTYSTKQHKDWETSVLRTQMALEDNFKDIAEKCSVSQGKHAVLLMDRGTMDVLAYVGKVSDAAYVEAASTWVTTPPRRHFAKMAWSSSSRGARGSPGFLHTGRLRRRPRGVSMDRAPTTRSTVRGGRASRDGSHRRGAVLLPGEQQSENGVAAGGILHSTGGSRGPGSGTTPCMWWRTVKKYIQKFRGRFLFPSPSAQKFQKDALNPFINFSSQPDFVLRTQFWVARVF
jgi:predicted ATPase